MPDMEAAPGTEPKEQFKVFIGGLAYSIKDQDLKDAFSKYDPAEAQVMIDKHTSRPRGFGFVWFKDKLGMDDAIRDMHEKELEGRKISVVRAVPQDQTRPGTPAAALGGGSGARRYGGDSRREYRDTRGQPDRYGGAYDRGYDRGGYGGYQAYDRGYQAYDRGYDSRGYGGYDRGHSATPYRDPYARDPYAAGYSYGHYGHDDRAGYAGYDYGRSAYDDRGAGGPDRRPYAAARSGPYDRPVERRPEPGRR